MLIMTHPIDSQIRPSSTTHPRVHAVPPQGLGDIQRLEARAIPPPLSPARRCYNYDYLACIRNEHYSGVTAN